MGYPLHCQGFLLLNKTGNRSEKVTNGVLKAYFHYVLLILLLQRGSKYDCPPLKRFRRENVQKEMTSGESRLWISFVTWTFLVGINLKHLEMRKTTKLTTRYWTGARQWTPTPLIRLLKWHLLGSSLHEVVKPWVRKESWTCESRFNAWTRKMTRCTKDRKNKSSGCSICATTWRL